MKNVMIDLETLAVTADAVIMSIGAVEFELDGQVGDTFYRSLSIDSNTQAGRRIDESTLVWWMQQSPEAQKVFHEPKIPLQGGLLDLATWFPHDAAIWSNGASFDIPILEHAYKTSHMEAPWEFWNSRCVRTYRSLPGAGAVERPTPKVSHNALDDALAQALYVQALHHALFVKEHA